MRLELPDGSTATVEPSGSDGSMVSRHVDGVCVWGQVFRFSNYTGAGYPDPGRHEREIAAIVDRMGADPDAYCRWWFEVS